jgi:MazG family protein
MSRAQDAIERLLGIMERLRGPGGCPWDREQTLRSLRPYVLEETYEVLEAIDGGDPAEHREELGDLLLQIVFQAQLAKEERAFDFADVANAISDKLVSRHPHVFGNATATDADAVLRQWAALKREEKKAKGRGESVLEGVPREMPALARADRLTEKASRVGFDWPDPGGAREKLDEELGELDQAVEAGDRDAIEHELGDVLFAAANLSRKLGVPPEEALRGTVARFVSRFGHVERELARRGVPHGQATLAEMDALWDEAKSLEHQAKTGTAPRASGSAPPLGKDRG